MLRPLSLNAKCPQSVQLVTPPNTAEMEVKRKERSRRKDFPSRNRDSALTISIRKNSSNTKNMDKRRRAKTRVNRNRCGFSSLVGKLIDMMYVRDPQGTVVLRESFQFVTVKCYRVFFKKVLHIREEKMQEKLKMT